MRAEFQIDSNQIVAEITREVMKAIKSHLFAKPDDDLIYSVEELAEYLRVSTKWVYAHAFELPHFKLGGLLRFRKKDIDRIIDKLALKENLKRA